MSSIASNLSFFTLAVIALASLIAFILNSRTQKQPIISYGQNKLFHELPIASIITNTKLHVVVINQSACSLFNITANQAVNKPIDNIIKQSLDQLEEYEPPIANSRTLILPHGEPRQLYSLHITPIEPQPHTEIGWLITIQQIEEQHNSNTNIPIAEPYLTIQLQQCLYSLQQLSKHLLSNNNHQHYTQYFQIIYANSAIQQLFLRHLEQGQISNKPYQGLSLRECIETIMQAQSFQANQQNVNLAYYISPQVPHSILCHSTELFLLLYQQISLHIQQFPYTDLSIQIEAINNSKPQGYINSLKAPSNSYEIYINICQALYGDESFEITHIKQHPPITNTQADQQMLLDKLGTTLRHWDTQTQQLTQIKLQAQTDESTSPYYQLNLPTSIRYHNVLVICNQGLARQTLVQQLKTWNLLPICVNNIEEAEEQLLHQSFHLILIASQLFQENNTLITKLQSTPSILLLPIDGIHHPALKTLKLTNISMPLISNHLFNAILSVIKEPQPAINQPEEISRPKDQPFDSNMATRFPQSLLVVEDNEINREVLVQLLAQFGYQARVAENGLVALEILRQQAFDTILMDVQMPYMDGLATVRHIRAEFPPTQQPQIIAVTANVIQDERDECFEAGMNDYINKPIDPQQLVAALERASLHATHSVKNPTTEASNIMTNTTVAPDQLLNQEALQRLYTVLGPQGHNILPSLLKSFHENAEQLYEAAANPNDIETLHRAAHTLKGNSDLFGAVQLTHYCRELERRAKIGDLNEADILVAQIRQAFDQAMISLELLVDDLIKETANDT